MRVDGDDLARVLERLAAETRADDAAAAGAGPAWLGRQAEEEATLAGVLVDLAERRGPIVHLDHRRAEPPGLGARGRAATSSRCAPRPARDALVRFTARRPGAEPDARRVRRRSTARARRPTSPPRCGRSGRLRLARAGGDRCGRGRAASCDGSVSTWPPCGSTASGALTYVPLAALDRAGHDR